VFPAGLINLGNTCYMNSSIQCLRRVNELKDFLLKSNALTTQSPEGKLAYSFQSLFKLLEQKGEPVKPSYFVDVIKINFSEFLVNKI